MRYDTFAPSAPLRAAHGASDDAYATPQSRIQCERHRPDSWQNWNVRVFLVPPPPGLVPPAIPTSGKNAFPQRIACTGAKPFWQMLPRFLTSPLSPNCLVVVALAAGLSLLFERNLFGLFLTLLKKGGLPGNSAGGTQYPAIIRRGKRGARFSETRQRAGCRLRCGV